MKMVNAHLHSFPQEKMDDYLKIEKIGEGQSCFRCWFRVWLIVEMVHNVLITPAGGYDGLCMCCRYLWGGLQGQTQGHGAGGGDEEDPPGERGGGGSEHGRQGGVPAAGTEAPQRCPVQSSLPGPQKNPGLFYTHTLWMVTSAPLVESLTWFWDKHDLMSITWSKQASPCVTGHAAAGFLSHIPACWAFVLQRTSFRTLSLSARLKLFLWDRGVFETLWSRNELSWAPGSSGPNRTRVAQVELAWLHVNSIMWHAWSDYSLRFKLQIKTKAVMA